MANSYYQRKATFDAVRAKKSEALRRDEHTDYSSGYFFVTLTVRDHKPLLGSVTGQIDPQSRHVLRAEVQLTPFGEKVQACWQEIPKYHPNVELLDAVVMPEHFHGLLHLNPLEGVTLSHIVRGFKFGCNRAYRELFKCPTAAVFSVGYNETVPFSSDELEIKRQYIHDNPSRRLLKEQLRDCFTVFRGQTSKNWTTTRLEQGLHQDHFLANHPEMIQPALDALTPRLLTDEAGQLSLSYIGSRELLLTSRKLPLICHRADDALRDRHLAAVLREAAAGAVIVSAFISPREREFRDVLLQEGYPIIEILQNGMSDAYKPLGKSFYSCAEGHLLQITPWTYQYRKDTTITRPECMVMNELARLISGCDDNWWKS